MARFDDEYNKRGHRRYAEWQDYLGLTERERYALDAIYTKFDYDMFDANTFALFEIEYEEELLNLKRICLMLEKGKLLKFKEWLNKNY